MPAGLPRESEMIATPLPACAMLFTASTTLAVRATSTGFGPMWSRATERNSFVCEDNRSASWQARRNG
jgi:hypothetical protein